MAIKLSNAQPSAKKKWTELLKLHLQQDYSHDWVYFTPENVWVTVIKKTPKTQRSQTFGGPHYCAFFDFEGYDSLVATYFAPLHSGKKQQHMFPWDKICGITITIRDLELSLHRS